MGEVIYGKEIAYCTNSQEGIIAWTGLFTPSLIWTPDVFTHGLKSYNLILIDCDAVEKAYSDNMYQRSELDYLIYNDPKAYAELVWDECPELFLKTATDYTRLCDLR